MRIISRPRSSSQSPSEARKATGRARVSVGKAWSKSSALSRAIAQRGASRSSVSSTRALSARSSVSSSRRLLMRQYRTSSPCGWPGAPARIVRTFGRCRLRRAPGRLDGRGQIGRSPSVATAACPTHSCCESPRPRHGRAAAEARPRRAGGRCACYRGEGTQAPRACEPNRIGISTGAHSRAAVKIEVMGHNSCCFSSGRWSMAIFMRAFACEASIRRPAGNKRFARGTILRDTLSIAGARGRRLFQ